MERDKCSRIKAAVKTNFDRSPSQYQAFEKQHGFFRQLNEILLRPMQLPRGARILDVGCGTGASSLQILEAVPDSRVWGLDISAPMLEQARASIGNSDRVTFVQGDAARLFEYFDFLFHAVVYSASVFLIPDYRESLGNARNLLEAHGSVGLTFMEGLYDVAGNHLLALAEAEAREGLSLNKPVKLHEFTSFFAEIFPQNQCWNEDFKLPEEVLRSFFSIPAMSAGLFPKVEYPERVRKVGRLFDHVPTTKALFRWTLMIGRA